MKTEIHPKYQDVNFTCACGATFVAGSTIGKEEFQTEICSACHPFYTGKQKLIDSSGRVDKFMAKRKKAEELKAKQEAEARAAAGEDEEEEAETAAEAAETAAEETPAEEPAPEAPVEEEKEEEKAE